MRTCGRCGCVEDGEHPFVKGRNRCLTCQREYTATWYERNKVSHIANVRERRRGYKQTVVEFVQKYKESHPCTDCDKYYPYYVMQFDHLADKELGVSAAITMRWSLARTQREMEKCELVCANCHAERTHQRSFSSIGGASR